MKQESRYCDRQITKGKSKQECMKPVTEPTLFALRSTAYEVDLCEQHLAEFEVLLADYIKNATPTREVRATTLNGRAVMRGKTGTFTTKDVRIWLQKNGYDVSETGRISNELIEEYRNKTR
jgi:hypothetical protein